MDTGLVCPVFEPASVGLRSEISRAIELDFQSDKALLIRASNFSLKISENPKVDVVSSALSKSGECNDERSKGADEDVSDALETQRKSRVGALQAGIDVNRSMTERVLETPAMESRFMNPFEITRNPTEEVDTVTLADLQNAPAKDASPLEETTTKTSVMEHSSGLFGKPSKSLKLKRKRLTTYTAADTTMKKMRKAKSADEDVDEEGSGSDLITPRPNTSGATRSDDIWDIPGDESTTPPGPPPSIRRKRQRGSTEDRKVGRYHGPAPRIVFSKSTIPEQSKLLTFLRTHGAKKMDTVNDQVNILCVGNGELKRTSKLVLAVSQGKAIVTDQWVTDSFQADHLLDIASYIPRDPQREKEWRFSLKEAVDRGRLAQSSSSKPSRRPQPFDGWTIYFTASLVRDSKEAASELQAMARAQGAQTRMRRRPSIAFNSAFSTKTLVVGLEHDTDEPALVELGWPWYSRDIVALSILRGRVENQTEEFLIRPSTITTTTTKPVTTKTAAATMTTTTATRATSPLRKNNSPLPQKLNQTDDPSD